MKPFIGIKRIWYGEPMTVAPTKATLLSLLASQDTQGKAVYSEVKNSHEGTWSYTQDDPSITDYINELTGVPYYRDMVSAGNKTIAFTMGVYAFEDRVALQGGELIDGGWKSPEHPALVYKSIIAETKTGNYIVFTNAGVVAKTNTAEKNLGLGVTAVAMDNETEGVADEYLFDGTKLTSGGSDGSDEEE